VESSHRGLRRRVAALALEVVVSKSETQGQLSGCEEQSGRTWSSLYLNSRDSYKGNKYVRSRGGGESRAANNDRGLVLGVGGLGKLDRGLGRGSLFFLTAIAIAIATRPFTFHENSVVYTSSSFVSSIHSLAIK
jgi:hypothetical protein